MNKKINENWYSPMYAIQHTFTKDEIEKMSMTELEHLYKLAYKMGEELMGD